MFANRQIRARRILATWLAPLAGVIAVAVAGLSAFGAGTAALYVTAFGATVLVCGLECLRRTG